MRNSGENKKNNTEGVKAFFLQLLRIAAHALNYASELYAFTCRDRQDACVNVWRKMTLNVLLITISFIGILMFALFGSLDHFWHDHRAMFFVISSPLGFFLAIFLPAFVNYRKAYLYTFGAREIVVVSDIVKKRIRLLSYHSITFELESKKKLEIRHVKDGIFRSKASCIKAGDTISVSYDPRNNEDVILFDEDDFLKYCLSKKRTGVLTQEQKAQIDRKHNRNLFFALLFALGVPGSLFIALAIAFLIT